MPIEEKSEDASFNYSIKSKLNSAVNPEDIFNGLLSAANEKSALLALAPFKNNINWILTFKPGQTSTTNKWKLVEWMEPSLMINSASMIRNTQVQLWNFCGCRLTSIKMNFVNSSKLTSKTVLTLKLKKKRTLKVS